MQLTVIGVLKDLPQILVKQNSLIWQGELHRRRGRQRWSRVGCGIPHFSRRYSSSALQDQLLTPYLVAV
jgi:hypothetical protein